MPVSVVLKCAPSPTTSTSTPLVAVPRSTRPVATVPRPEIEKTSGNVGENSMEEDYRQRTFDWQEEGLLQVTCAR